MIPITFSFGFVEASASASAPASAPASLSGEDKATGGCASLYARALRSALSAPPGTTRSPTDVSTAVHFTCKSGRDWINIAHLSRHCLGDRMAR